jgi:hypothetical protein
MCDNTVPWNEAGGFQFIHSKLVSPKGLSTLLKNHFGPGNFEVEVGYLELSSGWTRCANLARCVIMSTVLESLERQRPLIW